ncbi:Ras GTPase activating protein ira2 [Saitoella coloradoensis]
MAELPLPLGQGPRSQRATSSAAGSGMVSLGEPMTMSNSSAYSPSRSDSSATVSSSAVQQAQAHATYKEAVAAVAAAKERVRQLGSAQIPPSPKPPQQLNKHLKNLRKKVMDGLLGAPETDVGLGGLATAANETHPALDFVGTLTQKIKEKLPINTNNLAIYLENDPVTWQTAQALIELSMVQFPHVLRAVCALLETISAPYDITHERLRPLAILQSENLLLRILTECVGKQWSYHRSHNPDPTNNDPEYTRPTTTPSRNESLSSHTGTDTISSDSYSSFFRQATLMAYQSSAERDACWAHSTDNVDWRHWIDPPPLPPNLARYVFDLVGRHVHHCMRDPEDVDAPQTAGVASEGAGSSVCYDSDETSLVMSDILHEKSRSAEKVVAYVSASNWSMVLGRGLEHIRWLSVQESTADMGPLRNMALYQYNSKRLSAQLCEMAKAIPLLRKGMQNVLAESLRRGIWRWIELYPREFVGLWRTRRRLEGAGAEEMFDLVYGMGSDTKRKSVFRPLQTMLLLLCPDVFTTCMLNMEQLKSSSTSKGLGHGLGHSGTHGMSHARRTEFLANLKKHIRAAALGATLSQGSNKLYYEAVALCIVDICKAASMLPPNDGSVLRGYVIDVENEVWNVLFPAGVQNTITDQHILVEGFLAMYKIHPEATLASIVPRCLDQGSVLLHQFVLVKACCVLAAQAKVGKTQSWTPGIEGMYAVLAPAFRRMIANGLMAQSEKAGAGLGVFGASLPNSPTPSHLTSVHGSGRVKGKNEKRYVDDDVVSPKTVLRYVLRLYMLDMNFAALHSAIHRNHAAETMMNTMVRCIGDPNRKLRESALDLAVFSMSPAGASIGISNNPDPEDQMHAFWMIGSGLLLAISRKILEYGQTRDEYRSELKALSTIMQSMNSFLRVNRDLACFGIKIPERLAAIVATEISLLILLCSTDMTTITGAVNAFQAMVEGWYLTETYENELDTTYTNVMSNFSLYTELFTEGFQVVTRFAVQKRIRRMLRMMHRPTPANLAAWEEGWKRWRVLTKTVVKLALETEDAERSDDPARRKALADAKNAQITENLNPPVLTSDLKTSWRNYTGFCASLGGCCVDEHCFPIVGQHSNGLSNLNVQSGDPSIMGENEAPIVQFMNELSDLLVCNSVFIREFVRDTLALDLNPRLHILLLQSLETKVKEFFDSRGHAICKDRHTLFVEQAIALLKCIFDRVQDNLDTTFAVDVGQIILNLARYLEQLTKNATTVRIRIKMAQLCEVVATQRDLLNLRQEFRVKNALVRLLAYWTTDMLSKTAELVSDDQQSQLSRLQRDLDLAVLKAISCLLWKLPLQPKDIPNAFDLADAKSRLYYEYFSVFLKVLNRCRVLEEIEIGQLKKNASQDLQHLYQKSKDQVKDLGPLRTACVQAISNMLSANVGSGLKHTLRLSYHEEPKIRSAFLQILTDVLSQGTEFQVLAQTAAGDSYDRLVDAVTESLGFARALCDSCPTSEIDDMAIVMLNLFQSKGRAMDLLKALIIDEVENTDNEAELLRRNCMATKMMSAFAKLHGGTYLTSTLKPVLAEVLKDASKLDLELDPSKVQSDQELARHVQRLKLLTQKFIEAICQSAAHVPAPFRELCYHISVCVGVRFPEAKYTAVGAFVFLRYFCPAIVAPESESLVDSVPTREARRALLLIAKIVQNLANNVLFGAKEPFMVILNEFLTSNIFTITAFLRDISVNPVDPDYSLQRLAAQQKPTKDVQIMLHRFLFEHSDRIKKTLVTQRTSGKENGSNAAPESYMDIRSIFGRVSSLVAQLGSPPLAQKVDMHVAGNPGEISMAALRQFMLRNKDRNIDSILSSKIVYNAGLGKDGRSVIIIHLSKFQAEIMDAELMVYCVLKILSGVWANPYDLLMDATHYSDTNEMHSSWVQQLLSVIPAEARANCGRFIYLNVNTTYRRRLRKRIRPAILFQLQNNAMFSSMLFLSNVQDLQEFYSLSDVKLPKETLALANEPFALYQNVIRVSTSSTSKRIPVNIKIGTEHIQLTTMKPIEILPGFPHGHLNDVYKFNEIADVTLISGSSGEDSHLFVLRVDEGKTTITLSSRKRRAIIQHILKAQATQVASGHSTVTDRLIRPKDVPGTLLQIALLNIGSEDANLRVSAYNLLCAISVAFNFEIAKEVLSSEDICIPASHSLYVAELSSKLAATQPQLTFELVSEFFVGYYKVSHFQKQHTIRYIQPWLDNLGAYVPLFGDDKAQAEAKLRQMLLTLIHMTQGDPEFFHGIERCVWRTVGRIESIASIVLDELLRFALEHGVGSLQAELAARIFNAFEPTYYYGKLITRLRKSISRTLIKSASRLPDDAPSTELGVLIRVLLMVSFGSGPHAMMYLPEICHITMMMVGWGRYAVRASMHGILINTLQSMCTATHLDEAVLQKMKAALVELSGPKFRLLFGLPNQMAVNPITYLDSPADSVTNESVSLASMEIVAHFLSDGLTMCAPSMDIANAWRARWMSLITSTAFQISPALQPRAFIALGCLASEVDDDLLYQVLVALRSALKLVVANAGDHQLLLSIVMSLTKIVHELPPASKYISDMFWLAVVVLHMDVVPIFTAAVNLIQACLSALAAVDAFRVDSIGTVLLRGRSRLEKIMSAIDIKMQIHFDPHFSFALAACLLKGLHHPSTKAATIAALTTFLEIEGKNGNEANHESSKTVDPQILACLMLLLPVMSNPVEAKEVLWLAGLDEPALDNAELAEIPGRIFNQLDIPDNTTALLMLTLCTSMLTSSFGEGEKVFLYNFLAEAAVTLPEIFALISPGLVGHLSRVVRESANIAILEAAQSILFVMTSERILQTSNGPGRSVESLLEEIHFGGIKEIRTFNAEGSPQMKQASDIAAMAMTLIEAVIR